MLVFRFFSVDAFGDPLTTTETSEAPSAAVRSTVEAVIPRLQDFHNLLIHPPKVCATFMSSSPTTHPPTSAHFTSVLLSLPCCLTLHTYFVNLHLFIEIGDHIQFNSMQSFISKAIQVIICSNVSKALEKCKQIIILPNTYMVLYNNNNKN